MKKLYRKFAERIRNLTIEFPRDFDLYENSYSANDWTVRKDSRSYSDQKLKIYFKNTLIATTKGRDTRPWDIEKIEFTQGFESLRIEVMKVLSAAANSKLVEFEEEQKKKQELIKQAKAETKFLGPF